MEPRKESIHIILVDDDRNYGRQIGILTKEVVEELILLSKEREVLHRTAVKLRQKYDKALRQANKLMGKIIKGHRVQYDENTQAVGVSNSDLLYIGPKDRVASNPTEEPQENDLVIGKIKKFERSRYNETLSYFEYVNKSIGDHNFAVESNELKLLSFEDKFLKGHNYDHEKQSLVISSLTGRAYLIDKET